MNWRDVEVPLKIHHIEGEPVTEEQRNAVYELASQFDTPFGLKLIESWDRLGAVFVDKEEDETGGTVQSG